LSFINVSVGEYMTNNLIHGLFYIDSVLSLDPYQSFTMPHADIGIVEL